MTTRLSCSAINIYEQRDVRRQHNKNLRFLLHEHSAVGFALRDHNAQEGQGGENKVIERAIDYPRWGHASAFDRKRDLAREEEWPSAKLLRDRSGMM